MGRVPLGAEIIRNRSLYFTEADERVPPVAALLGVGYGGWVALSPSVAADLFGSEGLGATVGFLYTGAGVGALFGPPFAGLVVDRTGSYTAAIGVGLAFGVLGILPILALRPRVVLSG